MTFWRRLWVRERPEFSEAWMRDLARRDDRIEFHGTGTRWRWPLNKIALENGWKNRYQLRIAAKQQERKRA